MDYLNHITNHEKGKHLTYEDYVVIELRLKDGWKPNAIAKKELNCSANTVRNIIKKGMTPLYNGKVFRFKAKTAWKVYQENRRRSCRTYEALEKRPFLQYVEKHFQEDKWSLDACVGRALEEGRYDRSEILCTKTLYNYVDLGLLHIKNTFPKLRLDEKSLVISSCRSFRGFLAFLMIQFDRVLFSAHSASMAALTSRR